jgi:hypothetical protein
VNLVDKYDSIISVCALIAAVGMMIGTGLGVLGAGLWVFKKALYMKDKKP